MTAVLFVCLANICRSPMALSVAKTIAMRQKSGWFQARQWWKLDAAGTHATPGEPIDARAAAALVRRGYAAVDKRSRLLVDRDFLRFDLVLAMDRTTLDELKRRCPMQHADKLRLFLEFDPSHEGQEVPDPYFGDVQGFERVLDLCELGARALVESLGGEIAKHPPFG